MTSVIAKNFCMIFGFYTTYGLREASFYKGAAARGGGRDERLGRTNEPSPNPLIETVSNRANWEKFEV
jgi:hypothetical protein